MAKTTADPQHARFDAALIGIHQCARRECPYNATYILQRETNEQSEK